TSDLHSFPTRRSSDLPSLDQWLVQRVLSGEQRTHYAAMIAFFLGIRSLSAPLPVPATANQGQSRQATGNKRPAQQNRYAQVQRRSEEHTSELQSPCNL